VGGDGSTRLYEEVSDTVWVAETVARPDTLKLDSSEGRYLRALPGGVKVWFDTAQGYHVATENRLGHETEFRYTGAGKLDTIALPVPSGAAGRYYEFEYIDSTRIDVTAPAAGGARVTKVYLSGGRADSIMDPDGEKVKFGYSGDRIVARTDRRGTVTSYSYNSGKRVDESQVDTAGLQITTGLRPLESLGLVAAVDTGSASAWVNGPRTDVGDTTFFWLDRFGSPRKIVNALGYGTTLVRDTVFPALVTEVTHPNGFTQKATYDDRGNVKNVIGVNPYGDSRNDTTRYEYDDVWLDFPTRVVPPRRDSVVVAYDTLTGNRLWQQDARGTMSRVYFHYYESGDCAGFVKAVEPPETAADSVAYDAWCNVSATWTPMGFKSEYYQDAVGRDTLVATPIDSARTMKQLVYYDLMGRDTLRIQVGPAMPVTGCTQCDRDTVPAETLYVATDYDAEGNVLEVERWAGPDSTYEAPFWTTYQYDRAHRKTSENHGVRARQYFGYDPAGNQIWWDTPRDTVKMEYDELNRLARRIVPGVSYSAKDCVYREIPGTLVPCIFDFEAIEISADTAVFRYDSVGNMTVAANLDARIYRSYYPNSQLETDTLKLRKYDTSGGGGGPQCPPFCPEAPVGFSLPGEDSHYSTHRYGLRHIYDLNGRDSLLIYPSNIAASYGGEPDTVVGYEYYDWGALEQVTGLQGGDYGFYYDNDGRLDSLSYPGGAGSKYTYDDDGRLTLRQTWDSGGASLQADTLSYDRRGKLLSGRRVGGSEVTNVYSGLGQLAASEWWLLMSWKLDEWTVNALQSKNLARMADYAEPEVNYVFTYSPSGQLESRELIASDTVEATELFRDYDHAGNMRFGYERELEGLYRDEVYGHSHRSATGIDQKLRVYQQYGRQLPDSSELDQADDLKQEFRYDALGRRVMVRNLHRPYCDSTERDCTHAIERYIWDGDQLLYELRAPGDTSDNLEYEAGTGDQFGRVAYVHGPGIDAPLGIVRDRYESWNSTFLLVPHSDWRGQWELGTDEDGAKYPECSDYCIHVDWPSTAVRSYLEVAARGNQGDWVGSLLRDQRDPSGFLYRRNRYYDPMAGRFTQPDPIGLAGGINLYGFAGGDPANFADPFGLCPPYDDDPCDMSTGDPNLDDPETRNVMEQGYKTAPKDKLGYSIEQGGVCYEDGVCNPGTNATREHIDVSIDGMRPVRFDWHTHGNEGRRRPSGIPGDMYMPGPSESDLADAEMVYKNPVLRALGNASFPTYIVAPNHIYRITPGPNRNAVVTTFNRWKVP
jgi:RHS repeat-associated protein